MQVDTLLALEYLFANYSEVPKEEAKEQDNEIHLMLFTWMMYCSCYMDQ